MENILNSISFFHVYNELNIEVDSLSKGGLQLEAGCCAGIQGWIGPGGYQIRFLK